LIAQQRRGEDGAYFVAPYPFSNLWRVPGKLELAIF
jgi:hypothetical protein